MEKIRTSKAYKPKKAESLVLTRQDAHVKATRIMRGKKIYLSHISSSSN